jgi:CRP-like cAMP-binding protein
VVGAREFRSVLKGSTLFRELPDAELAKLESIVRTVRYAARQPIYRKGDPGGSMMIVLSGRVLISSLSRHGSEVILNIIGPGEVHGEISFLDGGERSADATAEVATEALVLHRRDFMPILTSNPPVAVELLRILCQRIRQTSAFVEDAVLLEVPARLYRRLRALSAHYGREEPGGGVRIEHGLSQQELADAIGVTRVSVNKQLAEWQRLGLIVHGRGFAVVRDMEALREVAED